MGASPHTLPFLEVKTYHEQLLTLGAKFRAKEVKKYIQKAELLMQEAQKIKKHYEEITKNIVARLCWRS